MRIFNLMNIKILILLIILFISSLNLKIFLAFRPVDFAVLFFIATAVLSSRSFTVSRNLILIITTLAMAFVLPTIVSLADIDNNSVLKGAYVGMKIFLYFAFVICVNYLFERMDSRTLIGLQKPILIYICFILSWPLIFSFTNLLLGQPVVERVSFPSSTTESYEVDGHALSFLISWLLVLILVCTKKNLWPLSFGIKILLVLSGIIGIILTGSRSGVVIAVLGFFWLIMFASKRKYLFRWNFFLIAVFLFGTGYFGGVIESFFSYGEEYRALNFSFNLGSSDARIRKVFLGLDAIDSGWKILFGIGPFTKNDVLFYDNSLIFVFVNFGVFGLCFCTLLFYYIFSVIQRHIKAKAEMRVLLGLFLVGNLFAEYWVLSRITFPIIIISVWFYWFSSVCQPAQRTKTVVLK